MFGEQRVERNRTVEQRNRDGAFAVEHDASGFTVDSNRASLCIDDPKLHRTRAQIFSLIWQAAHQAAGLADQMEPPEQVLLARAAIPYLNEPWYC